VGFQSSGKYESRAVNLLRYIISVLQAFLGVQSSENRDRDFDQGNPIIFAALAIALTILFVAGLFLFVNHVVLG
jgi:cytochrome b subunit of formate dehydrogenase